MSEKKKKSKARFLVWLFPLLVAAMILWGRTHYNRLDKAQSEYKAINEALDAIASDTDEKRTWGSEADITELRRLAKTWHAKFGLSSTEVYVLLEDAGRSAGIRLSDYSSRGKETEDDYEFETGEITIRGAFSAMISFLSNLEKNPESFIKIDSISVRPERSDRQYQEARISIKVLLGREED